MARQNRLCVVAALTFLTLGACGTQQGAASEAALTTTPVTTTSTTGTTQPPPTGGETSPPNQDNRCTSTMLSGTIDPQDSGAGNRYVTLVVRNTSQQVCTLWGYGGLELTSNRQPIPTNAERNLEPAPTLVTLNPGATAGKNLHWSVVATGDEPVDGPCQPQATAINVTPPDETAPFMVTYEFGPVCAQGRIETSAYFPQ